MKNFALIAIILCLFMLSCNNSMNMKDTKWEQAADDTSSIYNSWIYFQDSTCMYISQSKITGHIDTTYLHYKIDNDTISFVPFDEWVFVNSKLVITKDGLVESNKKVLAFKKVSK